LLIAETGPVTERLRVREIDDGKRGRADATWAMVLPEKLSRFSRSREAASLKPVVLYQPMPVPDFLVCRVDLLAGVGVQEIPVDAVGTGWRH
jgi:hypothetical protein